MELAPSGNCHPLRVVQILKRGTIEENSFSFQLVTFDARKYCIAMALSLYIMLQARLWIGLYVIYLRDWYRLFPQEHIYTLQFEEYTEHRHDIILKLYEFLTLSK